MLPSEVLVEVMIFKGFDSILLLSHVMHFLLPIASHKLKLQRILNKPFLRLGQALPKERVKRTLAVSHYCLIIKSSFCFPWRSLRPRSSRPLSNRYLIVSVTLFLRVKLQSDITVGLDSLVLLFLELMLNLPLFILFLIVQFKAVLKHLKFFFLLLLHQNVV